jgi:hypothetical protein
MPLIRIDMLGGKPPEYRAELRDTIYETVRDVVGVPVGDRHESSPSTNPTISTSPPISLGCIAPRRPFWCRSR